LLDNDILDPDEDEKEILVVGGGRQLNVAQRDSVVNKGDC